MLNARKTMMNGVAAMAGALCLSAGAAASAQDATQEAQSAMMVLDGSGSMWGQIDGVAKIEIARNVINDMLDGWNDSVHLGVMAYGHREKGACADIETLVNVGPVDKAAVMAQINAISPKGKTPISASVRKAAEALKYTEEKATVILVSDGLETCEADPCALANELEASGVDFTAHVIGFDINEEEEASLACLAENTGGRYMRASNASELTTALAETVETVSQAQPEPEPVNEGPQGVRLRAKLCESCAIVEDNMFWWVFETEQDLEGNRKQAAIDSDATAIIELPAREYLVRARYGQSFTETTITVEPGKLTDTVVNLNAGHLRVKAAATEGAEALKDNMFYWVLSLTTDLEGNRKQIAIDSDAQPIFRLTAGEYLIRARHGKAFKEETVTINPGALTDLTFDMDAGYLRVNTVMAENGDPLKKDMFYWVLSPTTDLEGKRKEIAIDSDAQPIFRLPAGDYTLKTRHGSAFKETPVTVTAGAVVDKTIVQNSGRVKVSAVQTAGSAPLTTGVFWWIYEPTGDIEKTEKQIAIDSDASPIFILPEGEYVVAVRYGGEITRTELNVTSGEEKKFEVVLN
ncbi:vWA domain-containing protein [Hyphococcus sp.]|uniref:vWA domain-containing protein n=1 Tax=Hyphococcus sp. TaxID=2038636 RepID=UPI0035C73D97